ncbi:hypothetical protein LOY46_03475 [Pseudomonas sichuanensis]|uniref:hypothetical protein n=1 Tax=Pseudomonas sichuanensis TaxID=2213015 RepID=UPI002160A997|nr:hypothetical protein [Pseudomonas sichuanensis]UVK83785.1 hypothetical protein LOY46_03475 [Pseudomonas sichuanensis]
MTAHLVYQPCSDDVAAKNLQTTILNPVSFHTIADLLEPDLRAELAMTFPDGQLFIWGLASPRTRNAWLAMEPGDTIIFNTKTVVTVSACFTHRTTNRNLALRLWGWANEATQTTWENIYFVKDVRRHAIRFKEVQTLVDSRLDRLFYRYNKAQSAAAFEYFPELNRDYAAGDVSLEEARQDIQEQQTDGSGIRPTRLEHRYIVRHLFQEQPTGHCCICLNEYPRHLLVAAHIKKRSACNTKERLDIENIAAPMCRLGCDPLFEHGYIAVKDGKVIKHPSREMTEAIASYVETILDKPVKWWSRKNRKYFEWHLGAHGFEPGVLADAD